MDFGDLQFGTNENDINENIQDNDSLSEEKNIPIEDIIMDIEEQLRYAFGQISETTNLNYKNFEIGIKEVFPGIPINKIKHIWENESKKNIINYHKFLKSNTADAVIKNLMNENEKKTGKKYEKIIKIDNNNNNINSNILKLPSLSNIGLIKGISYPEMIEDQKDEIIKLKKWKKNIGLPSLNISKELSYKLNQSELEKNILIDDLNRLKIDYDVKMGDLTTISNEILQLEERYNDLINQYQDTQRNAESYKNELENLNKLYKNELMKSNTQENVIKQLKELNESLEMQNEKLETTINENEHEISVLDHKVKALEDIIDNQITNNELNNNNNNNNQIPLTNKSNSKSIDSQQIFNNDNNISSPTHQKKNSVIIFKDRKLSFVSMPNGRHRTLSIGTNNLGKSLDNEMYGDDNEYVDYNSENNEIKINYEDDIRNEIEKEMKKEYKDKIRYEINKEIEEKYRIKLKQNRLKIDMDFMKLNTKNQQLYTALQKQININKKLKDQYLKLLNDQENETDTDTNNEEDDDENTNDTGTTTATDDTSNNSDDDSDDETDTDKNSDTSMESSDENVKSQNVGCFPCLTGGNNSRKYKRMKSKNN